MRDGTLLRQVALSPGMTIGACGWMEKEWMANLSDTDKDNFIAKRYMDDILLAYVNREDWDSAAFIKDFKRSECYMTPLKLEDGKEGTFLEARFRVEDNAFRYRLKNDNEAEIQIWRYQHYQSYMAARNEVFHSTRMLA
jgi:hypothetical protein